MKIKASTQRIVVDPRILLGKPVIRGTRIPVYVILDLLGEGLTIREIQREYPDLSEDDLLACMKYAACLARFEEPVAALQHA
jgi:uncharacterized protein (DUF433 family)